MARARWNGAVIAESDEYEIVEGNVYFPRSAVMTEYLMESETESVCPWKGTARYYSLEVAGDRNQDAAFWYPDPKEAASNIADHVAFWNGVEVER